MEIKIKIREVIIGEGCHLVIPIIINGKKELALIDTGATISVFDYKYKGIIKSTERVSAGLGKDMLRTYGLKFRTLKIGDLTLYDYEAMLINMDGVFRAYDQIKEERVSGIIGADILKKYKARIDYSIHELNLTV